MPKKSFGNMNTTFKKNVGGGARAPYRRPVATRKRKAPVRREAPVRRAPYSYKKTNDASLTTLGQFSSGPANSVRIREREFIGDLISGEAPAGAEGTAIVSTFFTQTYDIDPSNPVLFPWLFQIASCFETYKFHSCKFMYKSMTGVTSTNPSTGSVFAAIQYDTYNDPFTSKIVLEQYEGAQSASATSNLIIPLETRRAFLPDTHRYTRVVGEPATTGDKRLYDMGRLEIGSVSTVAIEGSLGELWVEYDVELFQKKIIEVAAQAFQAYDKVGIQDDDGNIDPYRTLAPSITAYKAVPPLTATDSNAINANPALALGVYFGTLATTALQGLAPGFVAFANSKLAGQLVRVGARWLCKQPGGPFQAAPNAGFDNPTPQGCTLVPNNPAGVVVTANLACPFPNGDDTSPQPVYGAGFTADVAIPALGDEITVAGETYRVTEETFAAGLIGLQTNVINLDSGAGNRMYLDFNVNPLKGGSDWYTSV